MKIKLVLILVALLFGSIFIVNSFRIDLLSSVLRKDNYGHHFLLKISWIDSGNCEILRDNFQTIFVLPWDFCKITDSGFLGYSNNRVEYFSNDNKYSWNYTFLLHHDIDYNASIFTFPEKRIVSRAGKLIKIDNVIQIHKNGEILYHWSSNKHLREVEDIFKKKIKLHFVPTEKYYEYTYINGASRVGSVDKYKNSMIFKPDNILISLNMIGFIIIDPTTDTIVWKYDYSKLGSGQIHSPRFLQNGHILFFLNESKHEGFSKIIEMDPLTNAVVWSYRKEQPFVLYNKQFGSVIPVNDNTFLVTHTSHGGQAFELDRLTNTILWEWKSEKIGKLDRLVYRIEKVPRDYIMNKPFFSIYKTPDSF